MQGLVDRLGGAQGTGDLGDDVQPGGAAVGLLAQRGAAQRGGHLLGDGAHEQRVRFVELVGAQVGEADDGLAPAPDHHGRRDQRLVAGRRPRAAGVGEVRPREQRLLAGANDLADHARVERVGRDGDGVAPPRDRPHALRAVAVVGACRPHRRVVRVAVQGDGHRAQQLVDAPRCGDLTREVGGQLEPLRPPLRLVLEPLRALAHAHADERRRHLVGDRLHQRCVRRVESVGLDVGELEHALAAALDFDGRQEQRLPAAVRRPGVALVGGGVGQDHLRALGDAGADEPGIDRAADGLRRRDVAPHVDDDHLLPGSAVDHGRRHPGVARVVEHGRRGHPERLVDRRRRAHGACDGLDERQLLGAQVGAPRRGDGVGRQLADGRKQRRLLAERRPARVAADDEGRHRVAVDPDRRGEARAALGPRRKRLAAGERQHERLVRAQGDARAIRDLAQGLGRERVGHRLIVLPASFRSLRKIGEVDPEFG